MQEHGGCPPFGGVQLGSGSRQGRVLVETGYAHAGDGGFHSSGSGTGPLSSSAFGSIPSYSAEHRKTLLSQLERPDRRRPLEHHRRPFISSSLEKPTLRSSMKRNNFV